MNGSINLLSLCKARVNIVKTTIEAEQWAIILQKKGVAEMRHALTAGNEYRLVSPVVGAPDSVQYSTVHTQTLGV